MVLLLALTACVRLNDQPLQAPAAEPAPVRSVILMIGDGMGPQQLGLLEVYARYAPGSPYPNGRTAFARLGEVSTMGLSLHGPADGVVTDSACSATQLALGKPSRNGIIGLDADGLWQPNLREVAASRGWATGVVSDTRITHATPAAFLGHTGDRGEENRLAEQIVASNVDVVLSGGRRHFVAEGGEREDGRDLLEEARQAGFDVVGDSAELAAAGPKVLGLFGESGMPDALSARSMPEVPSLAALTSAALQRLDDDEEGFFLMVEGGQIDWAAHANDAGGMLAELQRFEEAVGVVLDFVASHPDTLLVVTADHETGGFGLSPSDAMPIETIALDLAAFPDGYTPVESPMDRALLDGLAQQPEGVFEPYGAYKKLPEDEQSPEVFIGLVEEKLGWTLTASQAERLLSSDPMPGQEGHFGNGMYAYSAAMAQVRSAQTGVVWNTAGHTHTPVPVFAVGPGAEGFGGLQHHVDIGARLQSIVKR